MLFTFDSIDATYENIVGDKQIIDVRTHKEFDITGTLKGAYKIPLTTEDHSQIRTEFLDDVLSSGIDKNKPVYVICRSGVRSRYAAQILSKNGFKKVINLNGGILKLYMDGYKNFVK
ncbi:rhodanese-like domain-containing protein [Campylobacter corcagiensis]|uniref:Rhodanese-like domain-containing protein n=1 Tax=Campylobacter corcagiensis TaxID=1448857 RepID=A0A7M1LJ78_9BACT|nr:rhodanese-like domain-containing protein [Campylobacter corcagiensis]QKF63909.1 rhodanese-like domain-containing protein [Campylobacter corcagiensis]QOQ87886.1 rhodanese-like domain-containing protein [Campylobacter corcagiensis]